MKVNYEKTLQAKKSRQLAGFVYQPKQNQIVSYQLATLVVKVTTGQLTSRFIKGVREQISTS